VALSTTTWPTSRRFSPRARPGPTATCGRSRPREAWFDPETYKPPHFRSWRSSTTTISTGPAPATWPSATRCSSEEYAGLPHRDEYTGTADIAATRRPLRTTAPSRTSMNRELQAIWLTGKSIDDALPMPNWKCRTCLTADPYRGSTGRPRAGRCAERPDATEPRMTDRWSEADANAWWRARPWLCGFNFLPSTAVNFIEMWHGDSFDPPPSSGSWVGPQGLASTPSASTCTTSSGSMTATGFWTASTG
jgi:hypothetical protein